MELDAFYAFYAKAKPALVGPYRPTLKGCTQEGLRPTHGAGTYMVFTTYMPESRMGAWGGDAEEGDFLPVLADKRKKTLRRRRRPKAGKDWGREKEGREGRRKV